MVSDGFFVVSTNRRARSRGLSRWSERRVARRNVSDPESQYVRDHVMEQGPIGKRTTFRAEVRGKKSGSRSCLLPTEIDVTNRVGMFYFRTEI